MPSDSNIREFPNLQGPQGGETRTGYGNGGGSGRGGGTTEISLREYIDAQDEKTRAQNDARFAEVIARLEQMPRFWPLVVAGIAGLAGSIGLVFAVLAYAGDRFDGGVSVSGVVNQLQEIQSQRDNEQDERIGRILEALEQINLERSQNSAD